MFEAITFAVTLTGCIIVFFALFPPLQKDVLLLGVVMVLLGGSVAIGYNIPIKSKTLLEPSKEYSIDYDSGLKESVYVYK